MIVIFSSYFLAAIGLFLIIIVNIVCQLQFFLPAAAGVAGAPLGGTAAQAAFAGAFTGQGVGDDRRSHGHLGGKRAQYDQPVEDAEQECRYVTVRCAHAVYFAVPFIWQ